MRTLAFVVPVHGRIALSRICLQQLRRTCDALLDGGVNASAVIVSDEETLRELDLDELGFASVARDNQFVSRRFNDGIQLATDPSFNPNPVEFVVPCGSDDWVDHRLFLEPLPRTNFRDKDGVRRAGEIYGFQWMSFVRENGREICSTFLDYEGGSGIRIIPRELVAPLGYRPCDEDRGRGCDTSILHNLRKHHGDRLKVKHWHMHTRQIVDWKTPGEQLNSYEQVTHLRKSKVDGDPFQELAEYYPAEALHEMEHHYFSTKVLA